MWLWRVFESAVVRKLAYLLVGFVFALLVHRVAHAAILCYTWNGPGAPYTGISNNTSGSAMCGAIVAAHNAQSNPFGNTWTLSGSSPETPSATSGSLVCTESGEHTVAPTSSLGTITEGTGAIQTACPSNPSCPGRQGFHSAVTLGSATPQASGSSVCASDGCAYTMDSPAGTFTPDGTTLYDPYQTVVAGGHNIGMQSGMNTGQSCTAGGASGGAGAGGVGPPVSQGVAANSCVAQGGAIVCDSQSAGGKNCGTYNGDQVCVSDVPPGTCQTYASGGVACSAVPVAGVVAKPPDNGTAGGAATPDEQVTTSAGTVNYYSAATVSKSTVGVSTSGTGTTGAPTGVPTGTGTSGTGTAPCPPGQTCTGTDAYSGGGDCVTPPACSDTDPVECGIVNQEWLFRCESATEAQIQSAITTVGGGVGQVPASSVDMSAVLSESQAGTWGAVAAQSGECPGPLVFTFMGKSMSFDIWHPLCEFAGLVSVIVMSLAYMVAARVTYMGAVSNSF